MCRWDHEVDAGGRQDRTDKPAPLYIHLPNHKGEAAANRASSVFPHTDISSPRCAHRLPPLNGQRGPDTPISGRRSRSRVYHAAIQAARLASHTRCSRAPKTLAPSFLSCYVCVPKHTAFLPSRSVGLRGAALGSAAFWALCAAYVLAELGTGSRSGLVRCVGSLLWVVPNAWKGQRRPWNPGGGLIWGHVSRGYV